MSSAWRLPVFLKTLRDLRWQVFWYGVGLASLGALVVYVYPSYREQLADFEIPEALRALIGEVDYGTPEGFLSAEFFSWAPILGVIFAIMAGTSALAGEEVNGTLDLLLAQPISRTRLALEKMAAFALSCFLIAGLTYVGWLASVPFVPEMEIAYGRLLAATLRLAPLMLFLGALAMWCSALLPDRRQATGLVTAIAVGMYFLNYLTALVEVLQPLRWASIFFYHGGAEALTGGAHLERLAVIVGGTLLLTLLTLASFQRRDLGVRGGGPTLPFGRVGATS